jgi:tetratricopeptide (TPR) repeat protein
MRRAHWLLAICLAAASLDAQSLLEQADAAFRRGEIRQAVALSQRVIEADPNSVHARFILGVIAAREERWPEARKQFLEVTRLEPANPHAHFFLGQADLYQHRWRTAAAAFEKARKLGYPDRERLLVELALAESESGEAQAAMRTLATIAAPDPGWPYAAQYYAVMAFAHGKLGQPSEAMEAIRRARDLRPKEARYTGFLVSMLIASNRLGEALAEAIQAQRQFPDDPATQFLFGLASFYVTQGNLTKLALRNINEVRPGSPEAYLLDGMVARQEGRAAESAAAFEKAAKAGMPDAHLLLGLVRRDEEDTAGAERDFRMASRLNPSSGQASYELGKILLARGDTATAKDYLERSARLMPEASQVRYHLSLLYGRLGDKAKQQEQLAEYRRLQQAEAEAQGAAAKPSR